MTPIFLAPHCSLRYFRMTSTSLRFKWKWIKALALYSPSLQGSCWSETAWASGCLWEMMSDCLYITSVFSLSFTYQTVFTSIHEFSCFVPPIFSHVPLQRSEWVEVQLLGFWLRSTYNTSLLFFISNIQERLQGRRQSRKPVFLDYC